MIPHPALPGHLERLRVLHLSDLHIRRFAPGSVRMRRLASALASTPVDLIALTGDCMEAPGHEPATLRTLEWISGVWRSRLGAFGIFGNHDSQDFRVIARARFGRSGVNGLRFIGGRRVLACPGLELVGLDAPEDLLGVLSAPPGRHARPCYTTIDLPEGCDPPFRIVLAHYPNIIVPAADQGMPMVLAGHTHAGQVRIGPGYAPHTSSDVPSHLAAGVLRLRSTLCCVSRGIGEGVVEGLRINCPAQVPLYELRRGALPRMSDGRPVGHIAQVISW